MGEFTYMGEYINKEISKPVKCIYYAVMLSGNTVANKVPTRRLQKWLYQFCGVKIEEKWLLFIVIAIAFVANDIPRFEV